MVVGSRLLSRFVHSQIGKKYTLCSKDPNHTDCLKMLEEYLSYYDMHFPDEYEDITRENYGEKYSENPAETINKLKDLISSYLVSGSISNTIPGDVLVVKCDKGTLAIGVDCGNGYILSVSDTNGTVIERKANFSLLEAYKCQQQSL